MFEKLPFTLSQFFPYPNSLNPQAIKRLQCFPRSIRKGATSSLFWFLFHTKILVAWDENRPEIEKTIHIGISDWLSFPRDLYQRWNPRTPDKPFWIPHQFLTVRDPNQKFNVFFHVNSKFTADWRKMSSIYEDLLKLPSAAQCTAVAKGWVDRYTEDRDTGLKEMIHFAINITGSEGRFFISNKLKNPWNGFRLFQTAINLATNFFRWQRTVSFWRFKTFSL